MRRASLLRACSLTPRVGPLTRCVWPTGPVGTAHLHVPLHEHATGVLCRRSIVSATRLSARGAAFRFQSPVTLQSVRRLATSPGSTSADGLEKDQPAKEEEERKEDERREQKEEEQKEEEEQKKEEQKEEEEEEWQKQRGQGGSYKQDVNLFQKALAILLPLGAIGIGLYTLQGNMQAQRDDDTMQVDMSAIMLHVFHSTVYNVLDSPKLVSLLGDPLLVEPNKAKFAFSKDIAWLSYPLYGPQGHVCTVTVDLLRIDPTGEHVAERHKKPHLWYVAQVEVDLGNGKKLLVSNKMQGVSQPFDVIKLFTRLAREMQQQEEEYKRQAAAAKAGTPSSPPPA